MRSSSDADGPALCDARGTVALEFSGLSHSERYLFDCHGIVVLRGCLSPSEVAAAQAAVQRARQSARPYSGILEEPALQALITHPRLLPVLLEVMDGKPHLTSIGANHKDANRALNGLRPGGAAQVCVCVWGGGGGGGARAWGGWLCWVSFFFCLFCL